MYIYIYRFVDDLFFFYIDYIHLFAKILPLATKKRGCWAPVGITQHRPRWVLELLTLPKTNTQSLKIDGWKTTYINYFPFGAFRPIFRCKIAVSFREVSRSTRSTHRTQLKSPNQDLWNPMIFMANLVWKASNKQAEWSWQIVEKILLRNSVTLPQTNSSRK